MKKLLIKKNGSTLIMVMVAVALLTILGTVMASLALADYKLRITEYKAKRNLYGSESGIDEAYGIIGNMVDKAIDKGNKEVEKFYGQINLAYESLILNYSPNELQEEAYNTKNIYIKFDKDKKEFLIDEEKVKEHSNDIFKAVYKYYLTRIDDYNNEHISIVFSDSNTYKIKKENIIGEDSGENIKEAVSNINNYKSNVKNEIPKVTVSNELSKDDIYLNLKSEFICENIKKTVYADYKILVPDYKDTYYVSSNIVKIQNKANWTKLFAVGKDLKVNSGGNGDITVNINGDIYVKGNEYSSKNGKEGNDVGIVLKENYSGVEVNGVITTNKDIKAVGTNTKLNVKGAVFANNVMSNSSASGTSIVIDKNDKADDSKFPYKINDYNINGSVYTTDDLRIDSSNTNIKIKGGFYGTHDGSNTVDVDNSSAIVINTEDMGEGSSLMINEDVIINGTSYVTIAQKYQTGESVSIKGNYAAYTEPLTKEEAEKRENGRPSLKDDNIIFEYYNPLTFASKFKNNEPLLVQDKSEYIALFKNEDKNNRLRLGKGINFLGNSILSVGTIFYTNKAGEEKVNVGNDKMSEKDWNKIREINKITTKMMTQVNIDENEEKSDVKFSKIKNNSDINTINNDIKSRKVFTLINNDNRVNYAIVGYDAIEESIPKDYEKIRIDQWDKSGENIDDIKVKGLIVTKGNVNIYGNVDFCGTIIAAGDVNIYDNKIKNFTYDEVFVKKTIASNYELFKDVFNLQIVDENSNDTSTVILDSKLGTNELSNVIRDKLIIRSNWRVDDK